VKISTLIERLQEAQQHYGDLEVYVGQLNSTLRSWIDVNVDTKGLADGESWDDSICIVQAYTSLG